MLRIVCITQSPRKQQIGVRKFGSTMVFYQGNSPPTNKLCWPLASLIICYLPTTNQQSMWQPEAAKKCEGLLWKGPRPLKPGSGPRVHIPRTPSAQISGSQQYTRWISMTSMQLFESMCQSVQLTILIQSCLLLQNDQRLQLILQDCKIIRVVVLQRYSSPMNLGPF